MIENKPDSLLDKRRFLPLFCVQFLNAMSDHMLKNAILVMITYQGLVIGKLTPALSVNVASLLFIFPFFVFSSIAGKLADTHSKVTVIKVIKYCEVMIIGMATYGFLNQNIYLVVMALVLMGTHSTFFGPIKYSILPQYLQNRRVLLLANGYIELGTFVAVLVGQFLGSWYMASNQIFVVISLLMLSLLLSLCLTFQLEHTIPVAEKEVFSWNVFKDTWLSYKNVISKPQLRQCVHAISWFWAMGIVYSTQLPIFTQKYMGGEAHVFSILLAIFSISIGIGSVACSKLSNGHIRKNYVSYGAIALTMLSSIMLILDFKTKISYPTLLAFSSSIDGMLNYALIFCIGFAAGFYSITCYNELQVASPLAILSQVIAINNVLNAAYMLICSIVCTLLLFFVDVWWLFVISNILNLGFIVWYRQTNRQITRQVLN